MKIKIFSFFLSFSLLTICTSQNQWARFTSNEKAFSFSLDENKNLHIVNFDGLTTHDLTTGEYELFDGSNVDLFETFHPHKVVSDNNGNVWLSDWKKLVKKTNSDWEIINFPTNYNNLPGSNYTNLPDPVFSSDNKLTILLTPFSDIFKLNIAVWDGVYWEMRTLEEITGISVFDAPVITNFSPDHDENVWMGINDEEKGGVWVHLKNSVWLKKFSKGNSPLISNNISSVHFDKESQKIWIGLADGGLYSTNSNGGEWDIFNSDNSPIGNKPIDQIATDKDGKVWVLYDNKLLIFNGINWETLEVSSLDKGFDLSNDYSKFLPISGMNFIANNYIGGNGLYHINSEEEVSNIATGNSILRGNHVPNIMFEEDNRIWFFQNDSNIVILENEEWKFLNSSEICSVNNIVNSTINSLQSLDNGRFLFSDLSHGATIISQTDCINYNSNNSELPENSIYSAQQDSEGNLWFGYANGLAKFDGINWEFFDSSNSPLPIGHVNELFVDDDNTLWISVYPDKIVQLKNDNWIIFDQNNSGLVDYSVYLITQDIEGEIWALLADFDIGPPLFHSNWTQKKIFKFDGNDWIAQTALENSLPNTNISTMYFEENGTIWFGTSEGLIKYHQGNVDLFNVENSEIISNSVLNINIDNDQNVWIGTRKGVSIYNENGVTISSLEDPQKPKTAVNLVNVFPNPASSNIDLEILTPLDAKTEIQLVDVNGKVVQIIPIESKVDEGQVLNMSLQNEPRGLYVLKIVTPDASESHKIIVID